jgi:2-polyprenyl-6-hydroxyphenyl methylase/3-demethylubiquinone-9 3-methyltransferase
MRNYYTHKLSNLRLKQVYDLAPPRVRQYLEAELHYALDRINAGDHVLDLGCGYGRTFPQLCRQAGFVTGIDTSAGNLEMGREFLQGISNYLLIRMNANKLLFPAESFDIVLCLQNGISAFHINRKVLVREAIRVVRYGGLVLFSTYAEKFWNDRIEWFRIQSGAGLLGRIIPEKTGHGTIVCDDGFTAYTLNSLDFIRLTEDIPDITVNMEEVDESSLFCVIKKIS